MNYSEFLTKHILKKQTYTKSPKASQSALGLEQCYPTELSTTVEMLIRCAIQHGSHWPTQSLRT